MPLCRVGPNECGVFRIPGAEIVEFLHLFIEPEIEPDELLVLLRRVD